MTDLPDNTCSNFFKDPLPSCLSDAHGKEDSRSCHDLGSLLSQQLKIDEIHPAETHQTILDSYLFEPCGFSVNGFVRARSNPGEDDKRWEFVPERKKDPGEGIDQTLGNDRGNLALASDEEEDRYFSIHVTPYPSSHTYASFESNHPFSSRKELSELISRVLDIFKPGKICVTLFLGHDEEQDENENPVIDLGKIKLNGYKRTDRIGYEFDGYSLYFANWEKLEEASELTAHELRSLRMSGLTGFSGLMMAVNGNAQSNGS